MRNEPPLTDAQRDYVASFEQWLRTGHPWDRSKMQRGLKRMRDEAQPRTVLLALREGMRFAERAVDTTSRRLHPGVRSHLVAAMVQLDAAIRAAEPSNDQREAA